MSHNDQESQNTAEQNNRVDTFANGKPPLGLVPKRFRRQERFIEVCEAVSRYWHAGKKIPVKWIEEYNELIDLCR
jgi:hypothetical protein